MSDLERLIAAVDRGDYHDRPDGLPRFYAMFQHAHQIGLDLPIDKVAEAMSISREATAAALRALAGEKPNE